ncbi:MAG: sulfatase-like hydrolase/transferase, partial [Planctomycetes bacterium]|nr:sulfatase-like hydrolase/transferase [Planctomycetota bacterium]
MRVPLFVCLMSAACATGPEPRPVRPNILFVMIDDLGWMDLGVQGNERFVTPNVDRLAAEGTRFTDFYAAAPVCSPTR